MTCLIDNDGAVVTDERRVEVEDDVDEERQIDDGVDDQQRYVVVREASIEGQVVGNHHNRVKRQTQDQPVPDDLERLKVKTLEIVFRKNDFSSQLRSHFIFNRTQVTAKKHIGRWVKKHFGKIFKKLGKITKTRKLSISTWHLLTS